MFNATYNKVRRFLVASAIGSPVLFAMPVGGCNPLADLINTATELAQTTSIGNAWDPANLTSSGDSTYSFPQSNLYDPSAEIESAYNYRQEAYENSNNAWDEYIRQ